MRLGKISYLFFVIFLFINFYLKAEDKISTVPLINLENLEPSYEEVENDSTVDEINQDYKIKKKNKKITGNKNRSVNILGLDKITAKTTEIRIKLGETKKLAPYFERAVSLLASNKTKAAFDLSQEKPELREAYGKTEFGQRCLLARRLVEAGVPMVNVSYCHTPSGSWDTHSQNAKKMKESLAPTLDQSVAALLTDLQQRGMLEETLVVINAEFGRTPVINKNLGRDHWPFVYSLALAGAGVQGGAVYGKSDKSAAYPLENPRDPADMAATIYHLLGVSPATRVYDSAGRPHSLVVGSPIEELLS